MTSQKEQIFQPWSPGERKTTDDLDELTPDNDFDRALSLGTEDSPATKPFEKQALHQDAAVQKKHFPVHEYHKANQRKEHDHFFDEDEHEVVDDADPVGNKTENRCHSG